MFMGRWVAVSCCLSPTSEDLHAGGIRLPNPFLSPVAFQAPCTTSSKRSNPNTSILQQVNSLVIYFRTTSSTYPCSFSFYVGRARTPLQLSTLTSLMFLNRQFHVVPSHRLWCFVEKVSLQKCSQEAHRKKGKTSVLAL